MTDGMSLLGTTNGSNCSGFLTMQLARCLYIEAKPQHPFTKNQLAALLRPCFSGPSFPNIERVPLLKWMPRGFS